MGIRWDKLRKWRTLWDFALPVDGSSVNGNSREDEESVQEKSELGGGDHFGREG